MASRLLCKVFCSLTEVWNKWIRGFTFDQGRHVSTFGERIRVDSNRRPSWVRVHWSRGPLSAGLLQYRALLAGPPFGRGQGGQLPPPKIFWLDLITLTKMILTSKNHTLSDFWSRQDFFKMTVPPADNLAIIFAILNTCAAAILSASIYYT